MNWAKPFYDNLKVIEMAKGKKYGGDMFSDPALNVELEAYTFMRGRTFHSSWVICDEMQNTSILEARTALSRMGEKSKCVILADLTQIDNPYTDAESCGFSVAVESLKDHPIFAAVPLIRSKRSEISKLIAERMNPKT
jgi:PhoH-like ATPase